MKIKTIHVYKATVTRVIDGDTFECLVDLGFYVSVNITVRLLGIDTPETRRPASDAEITRGKKAKRLVESKILNQDVKLVTSKDKTGKYGRWLARVEFLEDNEYVDLTKLLIDSNLEKRE